MNKIFIIGNLTHDPELRITTSGVPVCAFSVAVSRRKGKGEQETDFFRVNAWRQLGETCGKYLSKGKKVYVSGELQVSLYDKDGTTRISLDISADEVEFLSPKSEPRDELTKSDVNRYVEHGELSGFEEIDPDRLPF